MPKKEAYESVKSKFIRRLALGVAALSLASIIGVTLISNIIVRNIIYDNVLGIARRDGMLYAEEINTWFTVADQTVQNLATILDALSSVEHFRDIAVSFVEEYDFIENVFIGFADGSLINGRQPRWVPPDAGAELGGVGWGPWEDWRSTDRPWFIDAKTAGYGTTITTTPYISYATGNFTAAISTWIPELGGVGAAVGFSMAIQDFFTEIVAYTVMGGGYVILLGPDGEIIIHPNQDYVRVNMNLRNLNDGDFLMESILSGNEIAEFTDDVLGTSYFISTPLNSTGWTFATVIPASVITGTINRYMIAIVSVFVVFMIMALGAGVSIVMYFSRRMAEKEREAAAKLRKGDERAKALMDACPLGITMYDDKWNEISFNPACLELFGLDETYEIGQHANVYVQEIQPDGRHIDEVDAAIFEELMETGQSRIELACLKADGTPMLLDTTYVRLDYSDRFMFASYSRDLTEERAIREREREVSELNEIFVKHSPFVMNVWDDAENIISTSPHALTMFELDSMEQYVERFFDLSPEFQPCGMSSRQKSVMYNTEAFEKGYARFEWMHQKLNGEPIPTEVILHRFAHGGKYSLATFAIDLRPIKAMLEKEANDRTRLMLETVPLMVEYWNEDLESIDCNRATLEFYNLETRDDYLDLLRRFKDECPIENYDGDDHRRRWAENLRKIFDDGYGQFEWFEPNDEGKFIHLEVEGSRIVVNGEPILALYSKDITERKEAEKEREDLFEKLKIANKAKSQFLSNMSHEIRTPMSAIIGMTEIAKNTGDIHKKNDCILKTEKASKHLLGLINQILDISKIEADKFTLDSHSFKFEEMLDEIVSVLSVSVDEKRLDFTFDIDPKIPQVIVSDEVRLAQVLTNLLNNAIKFTQEGGKVSLTVKLLDGDILRVEVADTGIGIPEEQLASVFDAFMQTESGASRKFGGTGLGLSISKRIVEMMGGRIWIESKLNEGTKLIFEAPVLADKNGIETSGTKPIKAGSYKDYTILLAEDIDTNCEIVRAMLEPSGVQIECASNGREALEMFKAAPGRYSLIFMDVQMLEMDGITATRLIRELGTEEARNIPIVAMTANVFKEDIDVCLDAGMNGHLGKPLDLEQVMAKLQEWLGD